MRDRFWEKYSLGELNSREWEALCDGCGQCCLKRRVENSEVTVYSVACELLDIDTARCKDYANRLQRVPTCHELTPTSVPGYQGWLPETCAYVRVHNRKPLPAWHPLLAGDRSRMRRKGITISHYAIASDLILCRRCHPVQSRRNIANQTNCRSRVCDDFPFTHRQHVEPRGAVCHVRQCNGYAPADI